MLGLPWALILFISTILAARCIFPMLEVQECVTMFLSKVTEGFITEV